MEIRFSFNQSRCVLGVRSYSMQSLFDSIMAEFESLRKIGTRVCATKNKYSITIPISMCCVYAFVFSYGDS